MNKIMKNAYLESFSIEELQQRNEFTAVDGVVSCDLKCLGIPSDTFPDESLPV
ncbi:hypothetical protein NAT51_17690 [Flavobacterium amniphilum]|uniref:hypothetical protein n=1 Tax=Flavobacterium amniphilum TaxID=1834035 RepID=UPI00202AA4AE|nr:hypothetical protein [Flavobacterium amniphilum]MCL9807364.1 hypothetical protein [Flavobacterium amniphilum]